MNYEISLDTSRWDISEDTFVGGKISQKLLFDSWEKLCDDIRGKRRSRKARKKAKRLGRKRDRRREL